MDLLDIGKHYFVAVHPFSGNPGKIMGFDMQRNDGGSA
jgi:hypothetical protein